MYWINCLSFFLSFHFVGCLSIWLWREEEEEDRKWRSGNGKEEVNVNVAVSCGDPDLSARNSREIRCLRSPLQGRRPRSSLRQQSGSLSQPQVCSYPPSLLRSAFDLFLPLKLRSPMHCGTLHFIAFTFFFVGLLRNTCFPRSRPF